MTQISTGYISCSGFDLSDRTFLVSLKGKRLSEHFDQEKKRLRASAEHLNINWPSIHHGYVTAWAKAMENLDDDAVVTSAFSEITKFTDDMIAAVQNTLAIRVHGIRLFRP